MRKLILPLLGALALAAVVLPATALAAPPANDDFANATAISSLPFSDSVDTTEATDTGVSEPQACYRPAHTIWYSLTPSSDTVLRADALGGSFDTTLTVYQGSSLSFVGCTAFGGSVSFAATAGSTYFLQLGSFFGSGGTANLNLVAVPPPANDNFASATQVASLPFSDSVDTTAATTETGEPSACFTANHTVWYAFTPGTSGSYTASNNAYLAGYVGTSLDALTSVGCRYYSPLTFHADAGTTYYFQETSCCGNGGVLQFNLDVAPQPVASFYYYPGDASSYDSIQFIDNSYDPGQAGFSSEAWSFGDGSTASGCCPAHKYAGDGNYTVGLTVTTTDGRTASTSQVVHVATHDVWISKLKTPISGKAGQAVPITVSVSNRRYAEVVDVQLLKSVAGGGFASVGTLRQAVPARGFRATDFKFTYTFTSDDAALGKVSFEAIATIVGQRDAVPGDNTLVSPPTRVYP
jgi:hypothetical protein